MSQTIPVLVDTDIGSNIDDALALAYLLRQPQCELLGVTTVTGDVAKRAAVAEVVCRAAGRGDVPIHCGAADPLLFGPGQPDVPHYAAVRHRPHQADRPPATAVDFLRLAIRDRPGEVVLLTIGPLTNVALLFALDPEIPSLLRRVVSMAGADLFPPPSDEPEWGAETNIRLDPVAAAMVFNATARLPPGPDGPRHVCVGLDVTMQCRMAAGEFRQRSIIPPLDVVLETAEAWFAAGGGRMGPDCAVFHDPLAAAAIFRPDVCRYADGRVTVDATPGGPSAGRTAFVPADGSLAAHRVAAGVDAGAFFEEYLSFFS